MSHWRPDWQALLRDAPELPVPTSPAGAENGAVYLVADSHLGDRRAPLAGFLAMLEALERDRTYPARLLVLMGDLCKVWLALPNFWDRQAQVLMEALHAVRGRGVPVWFVVGNREFFLPRDKGVAAARGLPFDAIIPDAAVLTWGDRRYGLTHGDLVNRQDSQYLKWRRIARGRLLEALFRAIPGPLAHRLAERLERGMSGTNRDIKISYPAGELQAFADTVLGGSQRLDGFFIGHFHRDETIRAADNQAVLRIIPDWHSRKQVLRLLHDGRTELLHFPE